MPIIQELGKWRKEVQGQPKLYYKEFRVSLGYLKPIQKYKQKIKLV